MPPRPITMLSGLTTAELTLTKRGANNRRFALTKGGIPMDPEVLQAIVGTPAEGETEFVATLKSQGVTDQAKIDAAVASYRVQKGMKDLVPDEIMATIAKSAGYEGTAKAVHPNEGKDDKKPDFESGHVDPKAKKKDKLGKSMDLSALDEDTRAGVEAIFKSQSDLASKSAEMEAVVKSLYSSVEDLKSEKLEASYVAKAAGSYGHIPMNDTQLGMLLKSAHDANPVLATGLEELLGRMNEMVSKSAMLTTMGAVNKANEGGGWDKIEALADGMVQKSASSASPISKAKAIDAIMKTATGQQLYREYLGDNPVQRAEIY